MHPIKRMGSPEIELLWVLPVIGGESMKVFAKGFLVCLFIVLLILPVGCSLPAQLPSEVAGNVDLWVTRDFGTEDIFCSGVTLTPNQSLLALLQEHLDIETEYGGGFVSAIEGYRSGFSGKTDGEQGAADWFLYINGILTDQGAAAYLPGEGDIIWWDFHPWDDIAFTPAAVGAFPQPFGGGGEGKGRETLILAGEGCSEWAEKLAGFLEETGAGPVQVAPYTEAAAAERSQAVLVLAFWELLCQSPFWEDIQEHRDKTGWFAELTPGIFYPLNKYGQRMGGGFGEKTGALLATGMGLGDPHPLWLITATDMEGLAGLVGNLVTGPEQFSRMIGALVVDGQIIRLPMQTN